MKKTLAVLLAVIMIFSALAVSAAAAKEENEWKKYPLILVPGYTSTNLYKLDENGMEHRGVFTLPIERDGGEYPW